MCILGVVSSVWIEAPIKNNIFIFLFDIRLTSVLFLLY